LVVRHFQHGQPPGSRVDLSGRRGVGCNLRFEIKMLAWLSGLPRRIHQAVAANENLIAGLWQTGHQIAALIIGDHDARELRRPILRLRYYPDPCFRSVGTRDDAPYVFFTNTDGPERLSPTSRREQHPSDS